MNIAKKREEESWDTGREQKPERWFATRPQERKTGRLGDSDIPEAQDASLPVADNG